MAEASNIEWTDSTFNPWMGCTKVSPACDHCYAETLMDKRHGKVQWGPHGERVRTSEHYWNDPRRWQKKAGQFFAEHGRRQRVFCASLADVFDKQAPAGARDDLWRLINDTPDLDWQLLTKRPQNIRKMLPDFWDGIRGHVWIGVSMENQDELDRRAEALDNTFDMSGIGRPAVIFGSAEPLLGPLFLAKHDINLFDWIIAGGESGPGARPTNPEWFRELQVQCQNAEIPFLFKQWGEWVSVSEVEGPGQIHEFIGMANPDHDGRCVRKVGKKKAGRTLDGETYTQFPKVA